MRILILEDDLLTAFDLQLMLEACGHEVVDTCGTVAEAGLRLRDDVDFAFLDVDLPDGKSFPIAARLSERRVPFAFVSGSDRADLPAALRHAAFIAKPYGDAAIRNSLDAAALLAAC